MQKKLALDLHGIITANPSFFASLTQSLIKDNWSIHICTGSHVDEKLKEELESYGIAYTHLFSIADHHRDINTPGMYYDDNGNPWVSEEDWDRTKADYCKLHQIDFCIDDTSRYAKHFETPFGYMTIQKSKDQPNKYLSKIIELLAKK